MGFNKIVAVSMTELFVQQIENMILSGELAIGEQLPPARELSVKMKIRKGEICRYTGALGLEVLDRRYVFAPEAAMKQAMDWYKERI